MNPNADNELIARFREATKNLSPNRIAKDVRLKLSTAKRLKKSPPKRLSTDVKLLVLEYLDGDGSEGGAKKAHVPRGTDADLTLRVLKRIYELAIGDNWTPEERAELDRQRELILRKPDYVSDAEVIAKLPADLPKTLANLNAALNAARQELDGVPLAEPVGGRRRNRLPRVQGNRRVG